MSTRKPRTQSKFGCAQCRKRRIKCDEGRPDCKNCARRKLDCSFRAYDPLPRSFTKRCTPSESPEGCITSLPSPTFLDYLPQEELLVHFPDVLRPRFRRLLQHFAVETSPTITHTDAARAAWCVAVPQLTARHMFVLQGTMAISALHLSKFLETESEKKHFRDIATYQMSTGLIKYRETVASVTEENAESLFAFSVTATTWVLSTTADDFRNLLSRSDQELDQHAVTESLVQYTSRILRTLRGVLVILVPCWNLIANSVFAEVIKRDWWPYPVPISPEAIEDDKRLSRLENMWMRADRPYEYKFDTLRQVLKALRDEFARVSQLTDDTKQSRYGKLKDWTAVMPWSIGLPLAFLGLVEAHEPEAWVIIAHYAILVTKAKHIHWLKDFGFNLVSAAALVLGENMRDLIQWPADAVGVDLGTLYSTHEHASLDTTLQ